MSRHCPTVYWLLRAPSESTQSILPDHTWGKNNFHSDDVLRVLPEETKKNVILYATLWQKPWSIPITPTLIGAGLEHNEHASGVQLKPLTNQTTHEHSEF